MLFRFALNISYCVLLAFVHFRLWILNRKMKKIMLIYNTCCWPCLHIIHELLVIISFDHQDFVLWKYKGKVKIRTLWYESTRPEQKNCKTPLPFYSFYVLGMLHKIESTFNLLEICRSLINFNWPFEYLYYLSYNNS